VCGVGGRWAWQICDGGSGANLRVAVGGACACAFGCVSGGDFELLYICFQVRVRSFFCTDELKIARAHVRDPKLEKVISKNLEFLSTTKFAVDVAGLLVVYVFDCCLCALCFGVV